ncbi:MAG: flagellar biosynthetic protein FliP [Planctomycetaceae bacterium]|nr:flagellar biosynthetic protein FliP [Planctomycetaceae bacterium]
MRYLIPTLIAGVFFLGGPLFAQDNSANEPREVRALQPVQLEQPNRGNGAAFGLDVEKMLSPNGLAPTLKTVLLLTVLSLAPSIMMMTTSFIRFVIVFGLLRQALGTQQMPPNQVMVALSLFMTLLVMGPVWKQSYEEGIRPYTSAPPGQQPTFEETFERTVAPIRHFMSLQIKKSGNDDAVFMLWEYQNRESLSANPPENFEDVSLSVLLPAFVLSELKTAFVIGFQIFLPFVIIDLVVSSVLVSMGMMMVPPMLVALPFKLLLFVMIDGWYLTVEMLLTSIQMGVT